MSTQILYLSSSLRGADSQSSQMADEFIALRKEAGEDLTIVHRDLNAAPLPHIDGERFGAFTTPASERSSAQAAVVAESDALIQELRDADELIIALPMYNFGIPSTFKAWIDHVARAGGTFRYTENGPVGLVGDKPVTVLAARGGQYVGTELDTQTLYVRHIFGLMGVSNIHFIYAEGLNMGPEHASAARQQAREAMQAQLR